MNHETPLTESLGLELLEVAARLSAAAAGAVETLERVGRAFAPGQISAAPRALRARRPQASNGADLLTGPQAAALIGLHPSAISRAAAAGALRVVKRASGNRGALYSREEIRAYGVTHKPRRPRPNGAASKPRPRSKPPAARRRGRPSKPKPSTKPTPPAAKAQAAKPAEAAA